MNIENYYKEKGKGYPLILLHGNGENHRYFIHQIRYFSKYYRTIAIDTRGHGKSPWGNQELSIDLFAEDLFFFCKKHNIPKVNIIGFSDGGNIGLTFAIKHPEMVNKLVLNGANLFEKGIKERPQRRIRKAYLKAKYIDNEQSQKRAEILKLMINSPNINPDSIAKLDISTLIIVGSDDVVKKEHSQMIHRKIKKSELVFIEGDHFIAYKKYVQFNKKVHEFLLK